MKKKGLSTEAKELLDSFPMSVKQFNLLLRKMEGVNCNETFEHTLTFIQKHDLNEEAVMSWLDQHFGGCDCSVIAHEHADCNKLLREVLNNDHGSDEKHMQAQIERFKVGLMLTAPITKSEILELDSFLEFFSDDEPRCEGGFSHLENWSLKNHFANKWRIIAWAKRHECFCDCEFHKLLKGSLTSLPEEELLRA